MWLDVLDANESMNHKSNVPPKTVTVPFMEVQLGATVTV